MIGTARSGVKTTSRLATFGVLLLILLFGMGLRLYQLDTDSLWLDEIKTVVTSRLDFVSMLNFQAEESVHPPLLYIVTRFFLASMGETDYVARLPAALLGSLSLLLTYKVGTILWTRREGMIGAFLLAMSAYHVRYSQEARHYSLMVFLALLSLIFLLKALQRGQWHMWILFALCTSLNLYTHYFAFLVLPSELVFAAWVILDHWRSARAEPPYACLGGSTSADPNHQSASPKVPSPSAGLATPASNRPPSPRKQVLHLVAILALVGLSYLPWLPFLQQQLHSRYIEYEGLGLGALPRAELSVRFFGDVVEAYTSMDGISLLLYLALFALGLASAKPRHIVLFGLWIAVPFLFPLIVRSSHFFEVRYAICVVPLFFLGMARGISALTGWLTGWLPKIRDNQRWHLAVTSVLTVSVFGAINVAPLMDYYHEQTEDWRGATACLREKMGPDDIIIADGQSYGGGGDSHRTLQGLTYYFSLSGQEATIFHAQRGLAAKVQQLTDAERGVWGVLWHAGGLDNPGRLDPRVELAKFPRVAVVRLSPGEGDLLEDTASIIDALLAIQPTAVGRFDLHLALAEIYLRTAHLEDAQSEQEKARAVQPDHPLAARDLRQAFVDFERIRQPIEDMANPVWFNFGHVVALVGYETCAPSTASGQSVDITLWWIALGDMDRDYTGFVHVVDHEGRLLAQEDRLLQQGDLLTSGWLLGSVAKEEYHLQLAPDTAPGDYVVRAGLYYWETGERLPARDEHGRRLPDDTIEVGTTGTAQ